MKIKANLKFTISVYDIYAILIILFPVCFSLGGIFGYYDEVIGVISFLLVWILTLTKRLNKNCIHIVAALSIVSVIGLISNLSSKLITEPFPIFVDLLWLWKTFSPFIAFTYIMRKDHVRKRVVKDLVIPAKLSIIVFFVLSFVGQVVDIGFVYTNLPFGLKSFGISWMRGISFGWVVFCCLLILALSEISSRSFFRYTILAFVPLIISSAALVYCFVFCVIFMAIVLRKQDKFRWSYVIPLVALVVLFTWNDIQEYFFEDSIRKELIIHGGKVANMYFPLGSGFATYGSEMAQRYYSKLYDMFGWRDTWGFGPDSNYLNDNFFASLMGQFGWIGFIVYLYAMVRLFFMVNSKFVKKRIKITGISTVLTMLAVMIGSASVKSMMGICTFTVLGIVAAEVQSKQYEQKALRQKENVHDINSSTSI